MTKILDRLPAMPRSTPVDFGQRQVTVFPDELLVWVSVGLPGEAQPQLLSPPFPALLDSGNGCDFYLNEHHLVHWAGISPGSLIVLARKQINQQQVPFREADVWVYPNEPGTYRRQEGKPPFLLANVEGVAVAPELAGQRPAPRLPLLGFPALRKNRLDFWFDGAAAHCYLRTAGWRSRLVRWLQRF